MAKCEYCGKEMSFGIKVSHSHRRSNRTWKPNIKKVKAIVNGSPKRVYVCTRCLRSGKVERAKIDKTTALFRGLFFNSATNAQLTHNCVSCAFSFTYSFLFLPPMVILLSVPFNIRLMFSRWATSTMAANTTEISVIGTDL